MWFLTDRATERMGFQAAVGQWWRVMSNCPMRLRPAFENGLKKMASCRSISLRSLPRS